MSSDDRLRKVRTLHRAAMQSLAIVVCLFAIGISIGCGGSASTVNNSGNGGGREGPVAASISGTIIAGIAPSAIAVDSASNKIYVADFGTQPTPSGLFCSSTGADVAVIDGTTESPTVTVAFPGALNPVAIALNPASHTAYVVARAWGLPLFSDRGCAWVPDQQSS